MSKRASILVADDDEGIREGLRDLLEEEGYEVRMVTNGMQAIAELSRAVPDLIVLDLMMPVMDGYRVLEELAKGPPPLSSLPVVIVTAGGAKVTQHPLIRNVIQKPIDIDTFLSTVSACLEQARDAGSRSIRE